jgi:gentisate 1,2-dioxygenase
MALLDSVLVQVSKGEDSRPLRTNSNIVCCVVEGSGQSQVGNETVNWKEKDIFTLPPGNWISHRSATDQSVLFMVSDRDVLNRLEILREELGNAQV